jgi:plasmid stability protein
MEAEVREILRKFLVVEKRPRGGFGTRAAALFRKIPFTEGVPELRGNPSRPVDFK